MGLPVERFYRSRDSAELALLDEVRLEGAKLLDELMTSLARKIVKEEADAQARGRKKRG